MAVNHAVGKCRKPWKVLVVICYLSVSAICPQPTGKPANRNAHDLHRTLNLILNTTTEMHAASAKKIELVAPWPAEPTRIENEWHCGWWSWGGPGQTDVSYSPHAHAAWPASLEWSLRSLIRVVGPRSHAVDALRLKYQGTVGCRIHHVPFCGVPWARDNQITLDSLSPISCRHPRT